jgi:hypothetical protein
MEGSEEKSLNASCSSDETGTQVSVSLLCSRGLSMPYAVCSAADRGGRTVGEVYLPAIPDCILSRCSCGLVPQEYMTYQLLLCDVLNV